MPDPFLNPSVRAWVADYHGSIDTTALGLAHAAGQRQVQRELYDAAKQAGHLEHLAKLIAEAQWQTAGSEWRWERLTETQRQVWRESARAVILAGYVVPAPHNAGDATEDLYDEIRAVSDDTLDRIDAIRRRRELEPDDEKLESAVTFYLGGGTWSRWKAWIREHVGIER